MVHRYFNSESPNFPEAITTGTANYSEFASQFPNRGSFYRGDGKPIITFEGETGLLFGEVALSSGDAGFELGIEGNLIKAEITSHEGFKTSSFFGSEERDAFMTKDSKAKVGVGAGYIGGLEYRKGFDLEKGNFTNEESFEVDLTPFFKTEETYINGINQGTSFKFGFPEFKIGFGLVFKAGAAISINPQPTLSNLEQELKTALENPPQNPKEKPDVFK